MAIKIEKVDAVLALLISFLLTAVGTAISWIGLKHIESLEKIPNTWRL